MKKGDEMKGKVLDFNLQKGKGVISGDDGKRYEFEIKEWKEQTPPQKNDIVDFEVNEEGRAVGIYYDLENSPSSGEKSKIVAFLLAFFLGAFGIHKFYLGCNKEGMIMLVVFIVGILLVGIPSFVIGVIAFIESLIYIFKSDKEFEEIYVKNKRCWF
jgi:TM2 domain-containing membrane protein YozV/cold shock CspA family protein